MKTTATLLVGSALVPVLLCAQDPAPRRVTDAEVLRISYEGLKADLIASAAAMPEADYSLRPGTMPEVRTFEQVIAHVAVGQFDTCARIKGVPSPAAGRDLEQHSRPKVEIQQALAESFAFCDDLFAPTANEGAVEYVRQLGYEITRTSALFGLLAHNAEMYGIATVYLRLKGVVPPSTARQTRGRG
jgi:hypothetical protein